MNRDSLAREVARRQDIPVSVATAVIDCILEVITLSLQEDEAVNLKGFGVLERRQTTLRGVLAGSHDRRTVAFRPSAVLKRKMSEDR